MDIARLRKKKEGGLFLSSKDSPEHRRMMKALDRVHLKLKQPPERIKPRTDAEKAELWNQYQVPGP